MDAMDAPLREIVTSASEEPSVILNWLTEGRGSFGWDAGTVVLQKSRALVYLHLDPCALTKLPPNAREIGHWGTGDLEITLGSVDELDDLKPLLQRAYEGRASSAQTGGRMLSIG